MPVFEPQFQSAYPDDFMDSLANLTASILQEHLAPIIETLQEHAKLMDVHTALLNHSTVMNRYNVGKIEDIRDFQNNINYKLQHFIYPEDRCYPEYQTHPDPTAVSRSETISNVEFSLPRDISDTTNPPATENDAETPEALERRPSPPVTEPADSRPNTPRQQQLGDGFSVVPGPSRRLQRERPFSVDPDPMWNSHREINPYMRLAAPAPPPPYMPPPAYVDEDRAPRVEPQTSSQTVQRTSPAPAPPVRPPSASEEEEEEEEVDASLSSLPAGERRSIADNAGGSRPSSPSSNGTVASDNDQDTQPSTQLSEKARGKKRMRDKDDGADDNPLEEEGSSSGPSWRRRIEGDNPRGEGSSSRNPISGRREGGRRKRQKQEDTTIEFNLNPVKIDDAFASSCLRLGGGYPPQPDIVRRRHGEKLKAMQKMFCGGRDVY